MPKDRTKLLESIDAVVVTAGEIQGGSQISRSPSMVGGFPMVHLGYLEDEGVAIKAGPLSQRELSGATIEFGFDIELMARSMEVTDKEVALAEKFSRIANSTFWTAIGKDKLHRFGNFPTYVTLDSSLAAKGKAFLEIGARRYLHQLSGATPSVWELSVTLDDVNSLPEVRYRNFVKQVRQRNLVFALLPDIGNFGIAASIFDASLSRYIGTLYNSPVWTYPYLAFDGVDDYGNFGDVLDDDGVSDLLIELWVYVTSLDSSMLFMFGKKSSWESNYAGWSLMRSNSGAVEFSISDGTAQRVVSSGAAGLTRGKWVHLAIAIDRDGNASMYKNGASIGIPVSLSPVGASGNAIALQLGKSGNGGFLTGMRLGRTRVYNFGAGGLPTNITNIISAHYEVERTIYGA